MHAVVVKGALPLSQMRWSACLFAFILYLATASVPASAQEAVYAAGQAPAPGPSSNENCADRGNNLVLSCGPSNISRYDSTYGPDSSNSTITQQIAAGGGSTLSKECCDAWSNFLKQSCRCNTLTEATFGRFQLTDKTFQQVVYAAAIACADRGKSLCPSRACSLLMQNKDTVLSLPAL
ncbi:hypothetical protein WJX73_003946 [Symbiochloris irregularis]|uniref:Uncharacterized protein n=1 Tax=Symbiochloris irregularis TaxID=706552 RepID=A0AAW1NK98_9CHLO